MNARQDKVELYVASIEFAAMMAEARQQVSRRFNACLNAFVTLFERDCDAF